MAYTLLINGARTLFTALGGAQLADWLGLGGSSSGGPSTTAMLAIAGVAILLLLLVIKQ